jgi:flavin reductase (DIM6/NTAB) family NADH-FMN oxidoreductase RutF
VTAHSIACDRPDPAALRRVLGHFATGVAVVTTPDLHNGSMPVGVTVNSFSAVSLDPPLVLFSAARTLRSMPALLAARHFGINLLSAAQRDISARFAVPGASKWDQVTTVEAVLPGCALLEGALAHFECVPHATHDGGDHVIFVLRVIRCQADTAQPPLLFFRGGYCALQPDMRAT